MGERMKITCPFEDCAKVFDWDPPADAMAIKHLISDYSLGQSARKQYSVKCPHCKKSMDLTI